MYIKKLSISSKEKNLVDISFAINSSTALVGESGSGKSLTIKALLGMLPNDLSIDLSHDADFEPSNGVTIAFVPQNPFTALSPLTKIRDQFFIDENEILELFEQVALDRELLDRFPSELSGGQLQRVVIAIALGIKPKLILLDEPTTALDPKTRDMILELLNSLREKYRFKMLFVTHDINSAKAVCNDICVIKKGKVVEEGDMQSILNSPKDTYTQTLINANFANRDFRN